MSLKIETKFISDKVAIVTGGNRGLGLEISRQLAQQGIRVVLTARNIIKGQQAVAELAKEGLEVQFFGLDVTSSLSIDALATLPKWAGPMPYVQPKRDLRGLCG